MEWNSTAKLVDIAMNTLETATIQLHHVALTIASERSVRCVPITAIEGILRVSTSPQVIAIIVPEEYDVAFMLPKVSDVDVFVSHMTSLVGSKGKPNAHLVVYEEGELVGHVRLSSETKGTPVTLSLPHSRLDFLRLASNRSVVQKLTGYGDHSVQFSDRVHQLDSPHDPAPSHDTPPNRVLILSERAMYLTDKNGKILQRLSFNSIKKGVLYTNEPGMVTFQLAERGVYLRTKYAKDLVFRLTALLPSLTISKISSLENDSFLDEMNSSNDDDGYGGNNTTTNSITVEEENAHQTYQQEQPIVQTLRPSPPPVPPMIIPTQQPQVTFNPSPPTITNPPPIPTTATTTSTSQARVVSMDRYTSLEDQLLRVIESKDGLAREVLAKGEEITTLQRQKDDLLIQLTSLQTMQKAETVSTMSNRDLQSRVQELSALVSLRETEIEDMKKHHAVLQSHIAHDTSKEHISGGKENNTCTTPKQSRTPRGTTRGPQLSSPANSKTPGKNKQPPKPIRAPSRSPSPTHKGSLGFIVPSNHEDYAHSQSTVDKLRVYVLALEKRLKLMTSKDLENRVQLLEDMIDHMESSKGGDEQQHVSNVALAKSEYKKAELQRELQSVREENQELRNAVKSMKSSFEPIVQALTQRTKDTLFELNSEISTLKIQLAESQRTTSITKELYDKLKTQCRSEAEQVERLITRESSKRTHDAEQRIRSLEDELRRRDAQLDEINMAVLSGNGHLDALRLHQARSLQEVSQQRAQLEQEVRSLARQCDDLRKILHGTHLKDISRPSTLDIVGGSPMPSQYALVLDAMEHKIREQEETLKELTSAGNPLDLRKQLEICQSTCATQARVIQSMDSISSIDLATNRILQMEQYIAEGDSARLIAKRAQEELNEFRERVRRLEATQEQALQTVTMRISNTEKESTSLREELDKAKTELEESKQKEGRYKKRNAELTSHITSMKSNIENLKAAVEDGKNHQQLLATRTKDLTEAMKELKQLRHKNEDLTRQLADYHNKENALNSSNISMQSISQQYQHMGSSPQSPPEDNPRNAMSLQKELSEKQNEIIRLKGRISQLESALSQIHNQHPDLKLEVAVALDNGFVSEKDKRICELEEALETAYRKNADVKLESEKCRGALEYKLRGAMEQLRTVRDIERKEEEYKQTLQEMSQAITTLQTEVKELREKNSHAPQWLKSDAIQRQKVYDDMERDLMEAQQRRKQMNTFLTDDSMAQDTTTTSPTKFGMKSIPQLMDSHNHYGSYSHRSASDPNSLLAPPASDSGSGVGGGAGSGRQRSHTPRTYSERLERNIEEARHRSDVMEKRAKVGR
eukprot:PhF_6_TR26723/c1_g1_i1/m.39130